MAELRNREQLESDFAAKLARLSSRQRRELMTLLGNPPDFANVPPEFWERVQKERKETMAAMLLLIFMQSGENHLQLPGMSDAHHQKLLADLKSDAEAYADQRSTWAAKQTVQTEKRKLSDLYGPDFQHGRLFGEIVTPNRQKVLDDIVDKVLGPKRDELISRSELAATMNDAGKRAVSYLDIRTLCYWRHSVIRPRGHAGASKDPCDICTPLLDTEESTWPDGMEPGHAHACCDCFREWWNADTGKPLSFEWHRF